MGISVNDGLVWIDFLNNWINDQLWNGETVWIKRKRKEIKGKIEWYIERCFVYMNHYW
jgi:hypothetical protein